MRLLFLALIFAVTGCRSYEHKVVRKTTFDSGVTLGKPIPKPTPIPETNCKRGE